MEFPDNLKYTQDHEWILIEGNNGTIGITEYAQSELGDVVFVDIDPNITEVKKGNSFGTIEAVKTVSDLYAPCSGKIIEINKKLADSPELVNTDPYNEGWMVKIAIDDLSELDSLLDSAAYRELIGQ
ncbi:MAG: glycine cleavage system protein GcvH [Ignavibacteriaceae bacterium]